MSTSVEFSVLEALGAGWWVWVPVCRCWVEGFDTGGMTYCPVHGWVRRQ